MKRILSWLATAVDPKTWVHRIAAGAAAGVLPGALLFLFFSTMGGLILFALIVLVAVFSSADNALLLSGAISIGTVIGIAGIWWLLPDIHYRPYEKYGRIDHYEPGLDVRFEIPHGDLVAIGGSEFATAAEPRTVAFVTDERGYRNRRGLGDDAIILVGDSFVAGVSSDQDEMLASHLGKMTGQDFYSLAFPGNLHFYADLITRLGRPAHVFMFEGNDFGTGDCVTNNRPPRRLMDRLRRHLPIAAKTANYRRRATRRFRNWVRGVEKSDEVLVERHFVAGKPVLFHKNYVTTALNETIELHGCYRKTLERIRSLVKSLVFVPTKYRVYHGLFDEPGEVLSANAQLDALRSLAIDAGIPVYNLTPALQSGAAQALERDGSFVYWRDDTHWNGLGARIGARTFACKVLDRSFCLSDK